MALSCTGTLYTRYSYATAGMEIDMRNEGLAGTVGLVVRVKGDGQTYGVILTTGDISQRSREGF